jgi:tRNA modification GTPase
LTDTIAAPATPPGTSGLAVLRVSGPDTTALAAALFGEVPPPRVVRHRDYRDRTGALIDDVLGVMFQGPHSYTGEDALEISCHGNPFIVQKILEDLLARGCRAAEPGEFTRRAFLNGRMDLSQAEAVVDVIHARSERALAAANQQLRGALGRRIGETVDRLVQALARVEAYIDFPEEDLPKEDRAGLREEVERMLLDTNRLMATARYGELLRDGIRVVILGAPNVGKSSLLNRFLSSDRALVSAEPGTTRDFIEERIIIGPHCFRLIDTAGLNPNPTPVEEMGMGKTLEKAEEADIFLVVFDMSTGRRLPGALETISHSEKTILVGNKADLVSAGDECLDQFGYKIFSVSALTGLGWEQLTAKLVSLADSFRPEAGEGEIAVSTRHAQALSTARTALAAAAEKIGASGPVELLASDLRDALEALGEIAGKIDNERMLDALFAGFCIGK